MSKLIREGCLEEPGRKKITQCLLNTRDWWKTAGLLQFFLLDSTLHSGNLKGWAKETTIFIMRWGAWKWSMAAPMLGQEKSSLWWRGALPPSVGRINYDRFHSNDCHCKTLLAFKLCPCCWNEQCFCSCMVSLCVCHRTPSLQAQPFSCLCQMVWMDGPPLQLQCSLLCCNFIFCIRKATKRFLRTSKIWCCQATGSPSAAPSTSGACSSTPPGCICINYNEGEFM